MVQTPDLQVVVGVRDFHFVAKDLRHIVIKVLAGVDDYFLNTGFFKFARNRGGFDKLRAGAYNGEDFHFVFIMLSARLEFCAWRSEMQGHEEHEGGTKNTKHTG